MIVNLPDPCTALLNRYYSREFFSQVKRLLLPSGVLAFSVSSSENYLNNENRAFLRSLNTTLKAVFESVLSVPGDAHIFLASSSVGFRTRDIKTIQKRLAARGVNTKYVHDYFLSSRLSELRLAQSDDILKEPGKLNTDTRPIAYLYDIVLWSTHFNTGFRNFVARFQGLRFWQLAFVLLLVL